MNIPKRKKLIGIALGIAAALLLVYIFDTALLLRRGKSRQQIRAVRVGERTCDLVVPVRSEPLPKRVFRTVPLIAADGMVYGLRCDEEEMFLTLVRWGRTGFEVFHFSYRVTDPAAAGALRALLYE